MEEQADICLFLEGTYPFLTGGVSTWAHDLIKDQKGYTFYLVCLLAKNQKVKQRYELPSNVVGLRKVYLQEIPDCQFPLKEKEQEKFFRRLEPLIMKVHDKGRITDLKAMLELLKEYEGRLNQNVLLESKEAWNMMVRIYLMIMGRSSFLNFFWSFRSLIGGLLSILLSPLPEAKMYHTFCTGFSGLFLARAFAETGKPCLTTEHGIYTNERRIEIASAQWLDDMRSQNLSIKLDRFEKDIKDYWTDTFLSYSRLCYEASDKIITLFEGNTSFQIADGADPEKLMIIPNGIDYDKYSNVKKDDHHPPTIALIGRVVHIKDIKTFIRSVNILKDSVKDLRAYIIGPIDEDPEYYRECLELIQQNKLEEYITLTGKVNIVDYLPQIDIMVLTSLSEGQPLTLLEAGAAGIPCVATNVGACSEIISGRKNVDGDKGEGGIVTPLANPFAISNALKKMFKNKELYKRYSENIQRRVKEFYHRDSQVKSYREIYIEAMQKGILTTKIKTGV
jgi:polysaccharide biosynthesis protein PelF